MRSQSALIQVGDLDGSIISERIVRSTLLEFHSGWSCVEFLLGHFTKVREVDDHNIHNRGCCIFELLEEIELESLLGFANQANRDCGLFMRHNGIESDSSDLFVSGMEDDFTANKEVVLLLQGILLGLQKVSLHNLIVGIG